MTARTSPWIRIKQSATGEVLGTQLVELTGRQRSYLLWRAETVARVEGRIVHIARTLASGRTDRYVPREPHRSAAGPATVAAATAARLREIADAIEQLHLPPAARPAITLAFEHVLPGRAGVLAEQAAGAHHDARQLHTRAADSASWYGTETVPPVLIEFRHPGPFAAYCRECGYPEPPPDFESLRRPAPTGPEHPPTNEVSA